MTAQQYKKLRNLAKREGKTESEALRPMIDAYLRDTEKRGLTYEPFRKLSPVGLKTLPRTIRKDQDIKLREVAEKTGRKISELVREAVDKFTLLEQTRKSSKSQNLR